MAQRGKSSFYLFSVMLILFHSSTSKSLSTTQDAAPNMVLFHKNSVPPDLPSNMEPTNTVQEEPVISVRINKRAVSEINAPVAFECQSRKPIHVLQGSIKDQGTRTPFIITVDPSAVKAGETVSVILDAIGGHAFRGLILQAVPGEGRRTGDLTGGRFLPAPDVNLQSCYSEDDTVTLAHHTPLEHLELRWAPSPRMNGDFYFIGTFVEDYDTFWANVISNPFTLKPADVQQQASTDEDTALDQAVHTDLHHDGDTGNETTQDMLNRNGVIAVEKLDDSESGLDDLQSIFGSDVRPTGNDEVDVDTNKIENTQPETDDVSPGIPLPQTAEFIGKILGALGGGGGAGGGGGGLGSMMSLMQGLGGLGGLGGVTSLLGGGRKTAAPAPAPQGLPPRSVGGEPSLADLLGVDPASVVDSAPAAVPSRPSSGGGGGIGLGKIMGGLGALGALRSFMGSRKSKAEQQQQQQQFGGGGFGGAPQSGMQQPPSMQTIMRQLQMQQNQIASLQSMLGQGSVTNTMMGGFGHSPSSTFGQQATNQMMGVAGQRPGGFQGTNTMNNGFNRQPTGGNQFTNNFGRPQQQFPTNGMLNNRPVQSTNQFAPNTNTFGQAQTAPAQGGQGQLMQELIRQNQLLMQQNQHLRSGGVPAVDGGQGGFGGQNNNNNMNNGMANTGQNTNNGMTNTGQTMNNNNQGFNGGNGFGQNGNTFGSNNNGGQNTGFGNNGAGMNGNFGQNQNTNNNAGNFGQNQNMNNNGGMNMGNNAGQNGFGNTNLNNQNMGQNTNNNPGSTMGNFGQNNIGQNGNNLGNNGNNFGQNGNMNGGLNGGNNGQNTNMNQNTGGMNQGGNFGMTGSGGFGNPNNMNNANNNFGGNPGGNNGFGGPPAGSNTGSSGLSGGLAGMFGGSSGNSNSNSPLGGLLGSLGGGGGGGGGGGLSSMLGMLGGGGGGGPDISSLLSGVDPNAVQNVLQGEEGTNLMNSMNQLMSTDTGGSLMNAMQGVMSGDMGSLKDIQGIMNGKDGDQLLGLAEQARGLMSQSGIDPNDLTALLGR